MNQRELSFFGGHPKSLQRSELKLIFETKIDKVREVNSFGAPEEQQKVAACAYNVCEKTDGVRYILIVTDTGECYFVSRNTKGATSRRPLFYKVNIAISPNFSRLPKDRSFSRIVEILDGELIVDRVREVEKLRFLIFDALVHLGRDIRKEDFVNRLQCA